MWRFRFTLISVAFRTSFAAALAIGVGVTMVPNLARAEAEKRVALVIGNGDYQIAPHLDKPPTDARAVADEFKKLGFQVVEGYDLDFSQMRRAVSKFAIALPDAKAAVVYYAGHAVSVDGENYLLPTDIVLKSPADLDIGAISISLVLKQMKREERANIVFLDASRDNPFAAAFPRNNNRCGCAWNRGLSPIEGDLARGTLVAFATDPNSTALDGAPGQHSPFTEALLDHLADPGAPIDTVMTRVRVEVWEKTNHMQRPWVNTSLNGEFSFNPQSAPAAPDAAPAPAPATPATSEAVANLLSRADEREFWESAKQGATREDYQAYLDKFPNGTFAAMAKNRIAALSSAPTTKGAPDAAPPKGPAGPSAEDLQAEVGTLDTENSLRFGVADRKEIQARLQVLRYYTGAIDGSFNEQTRQAIAEWQKKREVAPTGMLGPVEVAALRAESEEMYQGYLNSQPEQPDAQPENPQATPSVEVAPRRMHYNTHRYWARTHYYGHNNWAGPD